MKIEDLRALATELQTQDNLATANPLYCVQQKRRICGMDLDYTHGYEWVSEEDSDCHYTESEIFDAIRLEVNDIREGEGDAEHLSDSEIDPEDFGYRKVGHLDIWDFVCAHLTMKAAESYIEANAHNLKEPRVYVDSQYRCHEFNAVVGALPAMADAMEAMAEIAAGHGSAYEEEAREIMANFEGAK